MTAKEMFDSGLKGPNLMDTDFVEYGKIFDIAWELAHGILFELEMWTVTFIDAELKPMLDISMVFNTKIEAKKHIQDLTIMIQTKLN